MSTETNARSVQALHSFRLPSTARKIHRIERVEQLSNLVWHDQCLVLGEGTNTLFVKNFTGEVFLNRLMGIQLHESEAHWRVQVGAGENWHRFVLGLLAQGIDGLENLVLIPGSVGASPVQNIGAYGVEVGEFIEQVHVWDFTSQRMQTLTQEQCEFGYRDSIFKHARAKTWLITQVDFKIPKAWQARTHYGPLQSLPAHASAQEIAAHVIAVRNSKLPDPDTLPNAGSFFKNPVVMKRDVESLLVEHPSMPVYTTEHPEQVKVAAGWLIEQCGLKGFCVGDACVHKEQALVLVNSGKASGADIIALAQHVQKQVHAKFGIEIVPEVRLIGEHGEQPLHA